MEHKFKYILAIDPSGNYMEGKGITGWVLIDEHEKLLDSGLIKAKNYTRPEEFWNGHINLIKHFSEKYGTEMIVVIEDYILYLEKSRSQANSKMETCRLLGIMQWYCWSINQPHKFQRATEVKHRWADDVLLREGTIFKEGKYYTHASGASMSVIHKRDALRHAIHYAVCRNEKDFYKRNNQMKGAYGNVRSNYKSRQWETEAEPSTTPDNFGHSKSQRIW